MRTIDRLALEAIEISADSDAKVVASGHVIAPIADSDAEEEAILDCHE